jgi:site-specific recombinase XerD
LIDKYIRFERPEYCPTEHLFTALQGKTRGLPMTEEGFRTLFRYRRKKFQMHQAHPHRFRHTFGAELAKAGVSLVSIKRLMGHGDIQTTMQYILLSVSDIRDDYVTDSEILTHPIVLN